VENASETDGLTSEVGSENEKTPQADFSTYGV